MHTDNSLQAEGFVEWLQMDDTRMGDDPTKILQTTKE
jgi:hypothetical protein